MTTAECLGVAALVVLGLSGIIFTFRFPWLLLRGTRAVAALPRDDTRPAVGGTRAAGRVVCLAGSQPVAFCAGMLRPRIYVTAGALRFLAPDELAAVLVHESEHARRRDPLRRLLCRGAAEAFCYLPLAAWCANRLSERAELAADRAAIGQVGRRALARALHAVNKPGPAMVASFEGAGDLRVAQLLGDTVPARRPSRCAVVFSFTGAVAAVSLSMCLGQSALHALGL